MTGKQRGFVFGQASVHSVVALLIAIGGYMFTSAQNQAKLDATVAQAQADKQNAIAARNRADDVANARLSALEIAIRNCRH